MQADRLIAAFDVATATGCADGRPADGKPRFWTWDLSDAGDARPQRLALLRRFCDSYFEQQRNERRQVDEVVYELPLGIGTIARMMAARQFNTSEDVLLMLRGAIGVLEGCAAHAGVPIIRGMDIKDARKHLTGQRTFPSGDAKDATTRGCRALGWRVENDNEADACALWSLACGQANPRLAAALGRAHLAAKDSPAPAGGRQTAKRRDSAGALPLFKT